MHHTRVFLKEKKLPENFALPRSAYHILRQDILRQRIPKVDSSGPLCALQDMRIYTHPQQKSTNSSPEKGPCSEGNCIFQKKSMCRKCSAIQIATERFRSGVFFVSNASNSFHHYQTSSVLVWNASPLP